MEVTTRTILAGVVSLLALCSLIVPASADDFNTPYCSTQNTAGDFQALHWDWQSNGWCHDECNKAGTYAFAVIKWKDCWCSNYIPEVQQNTGDCQTSCPGFPSENCGSEDGGLYIYVKLDGEPAGTQSTPKPTSANVSPTSSAAPPSSKAPPSSEVMTSEVSSSPTTFRTTASNAPSSEASEDQPRTSFVVVTESGNVVTQTVVYSPTSAPVVTGNQRGGPNTGAIVGGVVGGVAFLAAIVGGIFFLLWRRRRQQREEEDENQSGVQRNTSTMSKAGLLGREKSPQYPPRIATNFSKRNSRTLDNESISPVSGSDRRSSRPYIFDQRLNPSAIMMNLDNTSRGSFASMDDSRDYGRTLNVRNPDLDKE